MENKTNETKMSFQQAKEKFANLNEIYEFISDKISQIEQIINDSSSKNLDHAAESIHFLLNLHEKVGDELNNIRLAMKNV
ncbi:hypothetical protein TRFO_10217 [Tritrichomonas foetus]|uniref:Uncharacterized protein n=1 Tax=Tritrichomonas foetus TaxID=1144522 RepID=A0A1J4JFN3_9EUKA|nr:hypothetical protein TRFO_10217 [Tritrichomonas foetus]|eukprot:OHS96036.1 hypothetical protein TRFO_10217 [Tritrichomonas foetus]